MILTCTSTSHRATFLRWAVILSTIDGEDVLAEHTFERADQPGTYNTIGNYNFTLLSIANSHLESTFSTAVTNALNYATIECTDCETSTELCIDRTILSIQGKNIATLCM